MQKKPQKVPQLLAGYSLKVIVAFMFSQHFKMTKFQVVIREKRA